MDREAYRRIRGLTRRLERNYRAAINTALQQESDALARLSREFASASEARQQYMLWNVQRQGGIASNLAHEMSRASETSMQMIRNESLNAFISGYQNTAGNLQRQVRVLGMQANWNMLDHNALNAIFNGQGRESFSQIVSLDRSLGNRFHVQAGRRLVDSRQVVRQLQDELAQSLMVGETQRQRMDRIQRTMGRMKTWKARRIAQTETARAMSQGRYLAAEQVEQEYGLPILKTWHHKAGQENPRLNHEGMSGLTIPKGELFPNGARYPQESSLPPEESINCHCSVTYRVDVDAMGRGVEENQVVVDNERGNGVMDSRGDTINNPIESRHPTDVPPPFGVGLDARQQDILDRLPSFGSEVIVRKRDVSMLDLAAMTAHTGDEFAMFTRKGERLVIRGNKNQIPITPSIASRLYMQGYRWSGHTHPGTHPSSLIVSNGDKMVLGAFGQSQGAIYNSAGRYSIFGRE